MYLLFGGDCYYPEGGFNDFVSSSCILQDLKDNAKTLEGMRWNFEWWHIVDSDTLKIVVDSNDDV